MLAGAKGLSMEKEKWLCWASLCVAGLMFFLFSLDLFNLTFGKGVGVSVDIVVIISSVLLAYLSWNALRDLR
jgi:hypothetical protein